MRMRMRMMSMSMPTNSHTSLPLRKLCMRQAEGAPCVAGAPSLPAYPIVPPEDFLLVRNTSTYSAPAGVQVAGAGAGDKLTIRVVFFYTGAVTCFSFEVFG